MILAGLEFVFGCVLGLLILAVLVAGMRALRGATRMERVGNRDEPAIGWFDTPPRAPWKRSSKLIVWFAILGSAATWAAVAWLDTGSH